MYMYIIVYIHRILYFLILHTHRQMSFAFGVNSTTLEFWRYDFFAIAEDVDWFVDQPPPPIETSNPIQKKRKRRKVSDKVEQKWVQCEHSKCLKWRRIAVSIKLPKHFFCNNKIYSGTCETNEQEWKTDDYSYNQELADYNSSSSTDNASPTNETLACSFCNYTTNHS